MLEMSPVLELVISDTSRPLRLSPSSGLTLTTSAVSGGRMMDLRYFLAGRELREKFQRTERQGVISSLRLRPGEGELNLSNRVKLQSTHGRDFTCVEAVEGNSAER